VRFGSAKPGDSAMIREKIEAMLAERLPGWQVIQMLEVSDESGPGFELVLERGGERRTVVMDAAGRVLGERC
jgi:hypothetical protein